MKYKITILFGVFLCIVLVLVHAQNHNRGTATHKDPGMYDLLQARLMQVHNPTLGRNQFILLAQMNPTDSGVRAAHNSQTSYSTVNRQNIPETSISVSHEHGGPLTVYANTNSGLSGGRNTQIRLRVHPSNAISERLPQHRSQSPLPNRSWPRRYSQSGREPNRYFRGSRLPNSHLNRAVNKNHPPYESKQLRNGANRNQPSLRENRHYSEFTNRRNTVAAPRRLDRPSYTIYTDRSSGRVNRPEQNRSRYRGTNTRNTDRNLSRGSHIGYGETQRNAINTSQKLRNGRYSNTQSGAMSKSNSLNQDKIAANSRIYPSQSPGESHATRMGIKTTRHSAEIMPKQPGTPKSGLSKSQGVTETSPASDQIVNGIDTSQLALEFIEYLAQQLNVTNENTPVISNRKIPQVESKQGINAKQYNSVPSDAKSSTQKIRTSPKSHRETPILDGNLVHDPQASYKPSLSNNMSDFFLNIPGSNPIKMRVPHGTKISQLLNDSGLPKVVLEPQLGKNLNPHNSPANRDKATAAAKTKVSAKATGNVARATTEEPPEIEPP